MALLKSLNEIERYTKAADQARVTRDGMATLIKQRSIRRNSLVKTAGGNGHGERGGTRTLDPMIKSHVLYRLSYALTRRAV